VTNDIPAVPMGDAAAAVQNRRLIGVRVRELRTVIGLSRAALAGRAAVSAGFVARLEQGNLALLDIARVRRVAAAVGVTAGWLIDGPPAPALDTAMLDCGRRVTRARHA
jgi:transcriptional regulator with XRE-family HTH domain